MVGFKADKIFYDYLMIESYFTAKEMQAAVSNSDSQSSSTQIHTVHCLARKDKTLKHSTSHRQHVALVQYLF